MAWTVSGNIRGPQGIQGVPGTKGDTGAAGTGIAIAGTVATYAALPSGLGAGDAGKGYLVTADGLLYIWDGSAFPADHAGVAFKGDKGDAATVAAGTATALGAGATPTVTNVGTAGAAQFNFGIPIGAQGAQGNTGAAGAAATVAAGTATALAAGAAPTVNNAGTSNAAQFNFGIPAGAKGDQGDQGNPGTTGTAGAPGTKWFTGTGAPGSVAGSAAGDKYLDTASGDVYTLS